MKKMNLIGLAGAALFLSTSVCDAHVLVYRTKLVGSFVYEDSLGKSQSESSPSTESGLWFFDLDTDCWIQSSAKGTSPEQIGLIERPKTSKAAALKNFYHYTDDGEGLGEHQVVNKFEFYSNSRKFYYFYFQTQNLLKYGFDTGSIIGQGACRLNVKIGGGRTSAVPSDFTGALLRGDGNKMGKGVLSYNYDAAITTAVNDYLQKNSIKSVKGSGVSTSIPAATSWVISTYLPQNGYVQVNAP